MNIARKFPSRGFFIFALMSQICLMGQSLRVAEVGGEQKTTDLDLNKLNSFGYAPLHEAVFNNDEQKVIELLNEGADIDVEDSYGRTPLWWAAERDFTAILDLLIKSKASIDKACSQGFTPLMVAACDGNVRSVKRLIKAGANVNAKDKENKTALDLAKGFELCNFYEAAYFKNEDKFNMKIVVEHKRDEYREVIKILSKPKSLAVNIDLDIKAIDIK